MHSTIAKPCQSHAQQSAGRPSTVPRTAPCSGAHLRRGLSSRHRWSGGSAQYTASAQSSALCRGGHYKRDRGGTQVGISTPQLVPCQGWCAIGAHLRDVCASRVAEFHRCSEHEASHDGSDPRHGTHVLCLLLHIPPVRLLLPAGQKREGERRKAVD